MQTQPVPTANLTFAPVTPPVARLLHQLQAELLKAGPTAPAIEPGAIVLSQVPAAERRVNWWNDMQYEVTGAGCRAVIYMQRYGHDLRYWIGSEMAHDAAGRMWKLDLGMMVMDDFGRLVQVAK